MAEGDRLKIDVHIKARAAIEDVYNTGPDTSGIWYRVTIKEGPATGSPFEESVVKVKAKVIFDDEVTFFSEEILEIDLYHYTMP